MEIRTLFYAYVGGLYDESGLNVVQEWLNMLLQVEELSVATLHLVSPVPSEIPPSKRVKSEQLSPPRPHTPIFFASQPPTSGKELPPHLPPHLPPPNPLSPAQPNLPFLPLFNQTASQRRVTVEYPATFTGPSHAGRWTVECIGKCATFSRLIPD